MGLQFFVAMGCNRLGKELLGVSHFAAGQAFLFHLTVLFSQFKETFGQDKARLHRHLVAGESFTEWLNRSVGSLVD
ncbi:MAG: hypothetical protein ACKVHP_25685, partial [Verrucomicrobiales bacterium]